jgi:MATE family multidrug resistance protein
MQNAPVNTSFRAILSLALPLILTMSGQMLMQFIDAIFLSWYSADAIAAVVPAGMTSWLLTSAFVGTAGYTSTFVAQYIGAGKSDRAPHVIWQGVYLSLAAGLLLMLFIPFAPRLFALVGHAPYIQAMEADYFAITCAGAIFIITASAIAGFFIGRGETKIVMIVHILGFAINAFLDYLLIFGKAGLPRLGIAGAAWATVAASMIVALLFLLLFLNGKNRDGWGMWQSRDFEPDLFFRLFRYGFPSGMRFSVEMMAWTLFVFFVGRIGSLELTATNIAWRINGIAFFPVIGFAQAIAILVGNSQGAMQPHISWNVTWKGIFVSQVWMVVMATLFLAFPHELFALFKAGNSGGEGLDIATTGVVLLRFVALYCLLDAFNYIFMGSLVAAGDTRWTMVMSVVLHVLFVAALLGADRWGRTLMIEWTIATVFVMVQALVWMGRFFQGKWKTMQVIEPAVIE